MKFWTAIDLGKLDRNDLKNCIAFRQMMKEDRQCFGQVLLGEY